VPPGGLEPPTRCL